MTKLVPVLCVLQHSNFGDPKLSIASTDWFESGLNTAMTDRQISRQLCRPKQGQRHCSKLELDTWVESLTLAAGKNKTDARKEKWSDKTQEGEKQVNKWGDE